MYFASENTMFDWYCSQQLVAQGSFTAHPGGHGFDGAPPKSSNPVEHKPVGSSHCGFGLPAIATDAIRPDRINTIKFLIRNLLCLNTGFDVKSD